jgi:hypothetical protein
MVRALLLNLCFRFFYGDYSSSGWGNQLVSCFFLSICTIMRDGLAKTCVRFTFMALHLLGIFCATFYHFYAHDKAGPIGNLLRNNVIVGASDWLGIGADDPKAFATVFIGLFMQVMGILQIPAFLGPSFTPFCVPSIGASNGTTQKVVPTVAPSSSSRTPPLPPPPPGPVKPKKPIATRGLPAASKTAKAEKVRAVASDVEDTEWQTTKSDRKRKKNKKPGKQKGE